jgi:DNA-binding Lrp family transcriptional regulator
MSSTGWTFLTNHTHVLVCITRDPDATMRAIADHIGITERAVQRIVGELVEGGYLSRRREGRRNEYAVDSAKPLRHRLERDTRLEDLLALLTARAPG